MSSRQRLAVLGCAAACLLIVAALAWMVSWDRSPFDSIDHGGKSAETFSDHHALLISFLRVVELSFAAIGMIVLIGVLVIGLLSRRRPKEATWTVAVMVTTSLTTTLLKGLLSRGRPDWQDQTDLVSSKSFPSGHASSAAALAGILVVLVRLHVRHPTRRRAATALVAAAWLLVCFDRVLLGRHFPTDVIAGSALGIAVMLLGLTIFDPIAEARHRDVSAPEARRHVSEHGNP